MEKKIPAAKHESEDIVVIELDDRLSFSAFTLGGAHLTQGDVGNISTAETFFQTTNYGCGGGGS
jgi:hypothetical protein